MNRRAVVVTLLLACSGCRLFSNDVPCGDNAGCLPGERCEANVCRAFDAGPDAGIVDAGLEDAGADGGIVDAGLEDAGIVDAGLEDAGFVDAGFVDAGLDAGFIDAGFDDAGPTLFFLNFAGSSSADADLHVIQERDGVFCAVGLSLGGLDCDLTTLPGRLAQSCAGTPNQDACWLNANLRFATSPTSLDRYDVDWDDATLADPALLLPGEPYMDGDLVEPPDSPDAGEQLVSGSTVPGRYLVAACLLQDGAGPTTGTVRVIPADDDNDDAAVIRALGADAWMEFGVLTVAADGTRCFQELPSGGGAVVDAGCLSP